MELKEWKPGHKLTPEEEPEYLKDLCEYLRDQQTLSEPKEREGEVGWVCEIIPDEIAAHTADVIEELLDRINKLQDELKEYKK